MERKKNIKKFCLVGQNSGYSLSPEIHNFVFKRDDINAIYEIVDIQSNRIDKSALSDLISNYNGFNITVPFKQAFYSMVRKRDEVSEITGSVNTVGVDDDGVLQAYNTDVAGIQKGCLDIVSRKMLLPSRMVLLGGGGAARSMIYAFLKAHSNIKSENEREIIVFLRNPFKGRDLEDIVHSIIHSFSEGRFEASLRVFRWDNEKISQALEYGGVIVNATPRGSINSEDKVAFDFSHGNVKADGIVAFDMTYNPSVTPFLQSAINTGVTAIGGLGMLVYQALASLGIWFEREFSSDGIFEHLRSKGFSWIK